MQNYAANPKSQQSWQCRHWCFS